MPASEPEKSRSEFSAEHAKEFLVQVPEGVSAVVVGGQAVNLWAEWYTPQCAELEACGPFTSKDMDVLGTRGALLRVAEAIGADVQLPNPNVMMPVQTGILKYQTRDQQVMNVDFITGVYGLFNAPVETGAIAYEVRHGGMSAKALLMSPRHCVVSRVANVVGIPHKYANPHGLGQLRASILVLREFIRDLARVNPRAALNVIEAHARYARTRDPKQLRATHGIDVLDAIEAFDGLPDRFVETRLPQILKR